MHIYNFNLHTFLFFLNFKFFLKILNYSNIKNILDALLTHSSFTFFHIQHISAPAQFSSLIKKITKCNVTTSKKEFTYVYAQAKALILIVPYI